jgi:hypothetical protein
MASSRATLKATRVPAITNGAMAGSTTFDSVCRAVVPGDLEMNRTDRAYAGRSVDGQGKETGDRDGDNF